MKKFQKKKYKVDYGSISENTDDGGFQFGEIVSGNMIRTLIEVMESNSQRSKKGKKNRESLKQSIYELLFKMDYLSPMTDVQYQKLRDNGIKVKDIEYDRDKVQKKTIEMWRRHFNYVGLNLKEKFNV